MSGKRAFHNLYREMMQQVTGAFPDLKDDVAAHLDDYEFIQKANDGKPLELFLVRCAPYVTAIANEDVDFFDANSDTWGKVIGNDKVAAVLSHARQENKRTLLQYVKQLYMLATSLTILPKGVLEQAETLANAFMKNNPGGAAGDPSTLFKGLFEAAQEKQTPVPRRRRR
tara:strand:+ start:392 stop:901 length:510 start_codon:yes stop_codon:yes gene_type:complete